MRSLLVTLFLALTGCGANQESYPSWPSPVPAELEGYLVDYLQDATDYEKQPSPQWLGSGAFSFVPGPDTNISGVCYRSVYLDGNGNPTDVGTWSIEINQDYWAGYDSEERNVLMYHELGHCLNHYDHRDNGWQTPYGVSIMYPYVWGYNFERYRSAYVQELFTGSWPSADTQPTQDPYLLAKSSSEQPEEHQEEIVCDSGQCVKEMVTFIHREEK